MHQEETRLLCKMSPASHFFFFEKVKNNNDNKSVHSCCEETLWANFQSRFSFPLYFQDFGQSVVNIKVCDLCNVAAIACNRMQLHAIACDLCNVAAIFAMSM
jgi:hypothetical protein